MEQASLRGRTLGGVLWMSLDRVVLFVVAAVTTAVLARLLPPSDFGIVGAALVAVDIVAQVVNAAVTTSLVQRARTTRAHLATAFWLSALLSAGLYGTIWLATPAIASFFGMTALLTVLPALALLFVFDGLSAVAKAQQQRKLAFREVVVIRVVADVVGLGAFSIALAVMGYGVWALVGGRLAQSVLRAVGFLARFPHPVRGASGRALREIVAFGGGVVLQGAMNSVARQSDSLVVGRFLGAGALGLYNRSYRMMALPASFLAESFTSVLFPVLSRAQAALDSLRSALVRATALLALALLPASGAVAVLAPEAVFVGLGPDWLGAAPALGVLAFGMFPRVGYKTGMTILQARGRIYLAASLEASYAALIILGAVLGWRYGIQGVAVGTVSAVTAFFVLATLAAARETATPLGELLRPVASGAALGVACTLAAYVTAVGLRSAEVPAVVTLLSGGAAALAVWIGVVATVPRGLGAHAAWLHRVAREAFGRLSVFESALPDDTRPGP